MMGYITKEVYGGGEIHCTAEVILRMWLAFAAPPRHPVDNAESIQQQCDGMVSCP